MSYLSWPPHLIYSFDILAYNSFVITWKQTFNFLNFCLVFVLSLFLLFDFSINWNRNYGKTIVGIWFLRAKNRNIFLSDNYWCLFVRLCLVDPGYYTLEIKIFFLMWFSPQKVCYCFEKKSFCRVLSFFVFFLKVSLYNSKL